MVEPLIGGSGIDKFMNLNHVAPPTEGRNVAWVTWGSTVAWVRKGEPFFTVAFLDSADSSTTTAQPVDTSTCHLGFRCIVRAT